MADDLTVVLSGPLTSRGPLLGALERAGATVDGPQSQLHPSHGLPDDDPEQGWVTCRHDSLDRVVDTAVRAGWRLRIHGPTPPPAPPNLALVLQAELDDMRARLDRLEGR